MSTNPTTVWTRLLGTSGSDYGSALTTGLDGSMYSRVGALSSFYDYCVQAGDIVSELSYFYIRNSFKCR